MSYWKNPAPAAPLVVDRRDRLCAILGASVPMRPWDNACVKMVDMSIHDVSGVVGWCLGAYSAVENTYVHHIHTFLHTGSGLYNPLQHPHIVPRPHILYNISTTFLQHSTTLYSLQLYSISTVYNLYNTPLGRLDVSRWPKSQMSTKKFYCRNGEISTS